MCAGAVSRLEQQASPCADAASLGLEQHRDAEARVCDAEAVFLSELGRTASLALA